MTDKLTPVPCGCGGEGCVQKSTFYRALPIYRMTCNSCGTSTMGFNTPSEAIEAWNRAMGADKNSIVSVFSSEVKDE